MKKVVQLIKEHKMIVIIGIVVIAGAFYFGYGMDDGTAVDEAVIETVSVTKGDIEVSVSGTGQVYAGSQVDLKPQVAGDGLEIMEVLVENDQEVKENDIIAILDTSDINQQISAAQLKVRSSEISLNEVEYQYKKQTEADKYKRQTQEVSLAQNQLSLNNAYNDLEDYYIRAPFNGTVTGLDFEVGDSISRTEILASVITDDVKAEISLNEVDAAMVKIGNRVDLTFDALDGVKATGYVSKVDTIGVVDGGVVTYNVEISFDSPSKLLKPGMSTNTEIFISSAKKVLRIPQSAVKEDKNGGGSYVMVSDGSGQSSGVVQKKVEIGITDDVMVEVKSGLVEGDLVVIKMSSGSTSSEKTDSEAGSLLPTPGSGRGGGPSQ